MELPELNPCLVFCFYPHPFLYLVSFIAGRMPTETFHPGSGVMVRRWGVGMVGVDNYVL